MLVTRGGTLRRVPLSREMAGDELAERSAQPRPRRVRPSLTLESGDADYVYTHDYHVPRTGTTPRSLHGVMAEDELAEH